MSARHVSKLESLLLQENSGFDVLFNEPMTKHTSYRIGGDAKYFVTVNTIEAMELLINACKLTSTKWIVIGKGSNLLVSDSGFDGLVIVLGCDFNKLSFCDIRMQYIVGAGRMLSSLVQDAFRKNLSGLEWAVGTPGTIGGAIAMNAGSADKWISNCLSTITCYLPDQGIIRYRSSAIEWTYRGSSLPKDAIILECSINLENAKDESSRELMEHRFASRKEKQPLGFPSCGSVFKNPENQSAGFLIEKAGLKGKQIGGAMISDKHANFILNVSHASALDVKALIDLCIEKVADETGIILQPEVKLVGF